METLSSLKGRGAYILFLKLPSARKIRVGRLGEFHFKPGIYLYVGSAMKGFDTRIPRYINGPVRKHWHIDYLLEFAELLAILLIPSDEKIEEAVAAKLGTVFSSPIKGFGSSDTSSFAHLFYLSDIKDGNEKGVV